jgi:hypothetical protein
VQCIAPLPSTSAAPRAYAQLEGPAQTWSHNAWTPVTFGTAPLAAGVTVHGSAITFSSAGYYKVTLSYRTGDARDVWTAVRLVNGAQVAGAGAGTGTAPGGNLITHSFIAAITSAATPYQLQIGRREASATIDAPKAIEGVTPAAVQATFEQL